MKSTGEVMAIGRTFQEALGKGISSMDQKNELWGKIGVSDLPRERIMEGLRAADDTRLMWIFRALAKGISPSEVSDITGIDRFFVECIATMVQAERDLADCRERISSIERGNADADVAPVLRRAKQLGISDRRIAALWGVNEKTSEM